MHAGQTTIFWLVKYWPKDSMMQQRLRTPKNGLQFCLNVFLSRSMLHLMCLDHDGFFVNFMCICLSVSAVAPRAALSMKVLSVWNQSSRGSELTYNSKQFNNASHPKLLSVCVIFTAIVDLIVTSFIHGTHDCSCMELICWKNRAKQNFFLQESQLPSFSLSSLEFLVQICLDPHEFAHPSVDPHDSIVPVHPD
jgi:hypothetical protein